MATGDNEGTCCIALLASPQKKQAWSSRAALRAPPNRLHNLLNNRIAQVRRTVKTVDFPTEPPTRSKLTGDGSDYLKDTREHRKRADVKEILSRLNLSSEARTVLFGRKAQE